MEKRRSRSKFKSPVPTSTKAFIIRNDVSTVGLGLQIPSGTGARQSRTPSPSGLTDNWSPVSSPKRRGKRTQSPSKQGSMSSSGDEDPEDVRRRRSSRRSLQRAGSAMALPESAWHGSGDFANQMFYIVV